MKLKALLLGLAFLASLLILCALPASGQMSTLTNIINSKPGISYNANSITVSTSYVVKPEDHTVLVNAASGAVTITIPPPGARAYPFLVVKKIDASANAVTVDPAGSATIFFGGCAGVGHDLFPPSGGLNHG